MKNDVRSQMRDLAEASQLPVNKHGEVGRPDEIDPAAAKALLNGMSHYRQRMEEMQTKWLAEMKSFKKLLQAFKLPQQQSQGSAFHNVAKLMDSKPEHVGDMYNSFDKEIETLEAAEAELKKVVK